MGRLPPTRKYRKRKSGRDPVLPAPTTGKLRIKQVRPGTGHAQRMRRTPARQGGHVRPGVEGGQMPLIRRIPKRGFTNPFKQPAQVVNVRHLVLLAEGVEVTPETLFGAGLVRRPDHPIKLLGTGDVSGRKFVVQGVVVSAGEIQKVGKAGGTIA